MSHQTFGLLLKENLLPRTYQIAQSGHTGYDKEYGKRKRIVRRCQQQQHQCAFEKLIKCKNR